jgi:hypothetical protein
LLIWEFAIYAPPGVVRIINAKFLDSGVTTFHFAYPSRPMILACKEIESAYNDLKKPHNGYMSLTPHLKLEANTFKDTLVLPQWFSGFGHHYIKSFFYQKATQSIRNVGLSLTVKELSYWFKGNGDDAPVVRFPDLFKSFPSMDTLWLLPHETSEQITEGDLT